MYALRALAYLVSHGGEQDYVSIGQISTELDISFHFLTKIFQQLTQAGMLESSRGPSGGIRLAKPPKDIRLADIVLVLEGPDFFDTCLLGLPGCGAFAPCPVHDFWKDTKEALRKEFSVTTLAELGAKVSEERLRIKP
ncbi:MAG: hypothetical protein KatS3mg029_0116 [Saprospiraceae bacterium]|nr:MAG: hypothetical protein KatS3mg029_0116 [Saprospiraceae bacterium]